VLVDGDHARRSAARAKSQCMVHNLVEKTSLGQQPKVESKLAQIDEDPKDGGGDKAVNGEASFKDEVRATHSRLLTKKQLSDMAMSVRSLAKRLGSLKVKLKIRSVFLLTKAHDRTLIAKTRDVARWLLSKERDVPYIVYVEDTMRENEVFDAKGLAAEDPAYGERLKYWDNELARRHPHTFDFVVTLGGDGTVLYASWLFQRVVPPVLSFALGSLGFLTKFDFNDYENTLTQAFRDGVTISLRLRFEGTVMRSQRREGEDLGKLDLVEEMIEEEAEGKHTHKPDRTYEILNDIVVDRGPNPTMSTIELFGDEEHLTTVQADGICVATPTGSTAYNLAAGGSLCHPENPVILVTAICAHTLSFRPIILPDTIVLRLGVPYDARANSWASFDGRERYVLGKYYTVLANHSQN
jgi:NAD+ kinase